jgi:hypothetical protein
MGRPLGSVSFGMRDLGIRRPPDFALAHDRRDPHRRARPHNLGQVEAPSRKVLELLHIDKASFKQNPACRNARA